MENLEQLWAKYDEAVLKAEDGSDGALADKVLLRVEIMMLMLGAHYRQLDAEKAKPAEAGLADRGLRGL